MTTFDFFMEEVDVRTLRAFVTAAEEGHFTRAAETLKLSQPQVSLLIRKLETLARARLFDRKPTVRLTAAGEALLPFARRALEEVRRGFGAVLHLAEGLAGQLTLGFPTWTFGTPIPDAIHQYRIRYPQVAVTLLALTSMEQLAAVQSGALDLAFVRETKAPKDLSLEKLWDEPWIVAIPLGHRLAAERSVSIARVAEEPLISFLPAVAPSLHEQWLDLFAGAGVRPLVRQETESWLTILGLVRAGAGVGVVPASMRRQLPSELSYLPLDDTDRRTAVYVCRNNERVNPTADKFLALAREEVRRRPWPD